MFIVGVALALIAFLAMFAFGILFARGSQGTSQVTVVVASQDIQPRQPITLDLVTTTSLASNAVPPRAITRLTDVTSYFAQVTIYKGEVISANLVASNPDAITAGTYSAYLPIPTGYVAVAIPSAEQQAVAGFIAQGDYINVIATADLSEFASNRHGSVTMTVFTDVLVIRVGAQSAAPGAGQAQGVSSSLTVLMTQCDANFITWLLANSTLKYELLSSKDYQTSPPAANQACPGTKAAHGVTAAAVDARWSFTKA